MTQKNKVLSRLLVDLSGAFLGLLTGLLCLHLFRNGVSSPLSNTDWFILISTTFSGLLLSSVCHKHIGRLLKPVKN